LNVYVIGVATHAAATAERSLRLEEMAYRTSRAALDDARVTRAQLDHLTIGACDELDGRPISSMSFQPNRPRFSTLLSLTRTPAEITN